MLHQNKIDFFETDSCICESKSFCFETKLSFERVPGGKSERAWAKLHFILRGSSLGFKMSGRVEGGSVIGGRGVSR